MTLRTRLTEFFGIDNPVLLAPMADVSGGRLAAAVTAAGGLGLIGGGYGDADWLQSQFDVAQGARVGVGFITWSLARNPELLDVALDGRPTTVMLSFGDPRKFAERVRRAGVPLTCQVQTLEQARRAVEVGAEVVVAQGGEAGGHGMSARSTFTLVPDIVDLVAQHSPTTLVVAAGGVADGRGLAAALALGADGVLVGTRLWASPEALVTPQAQQRAVDECGDDTLRTRVYDLVRQRDWPEYYDARLVINPLIRSLRFKAKPVRKNFEYWKVLNFKNNSDWNRYMASQFIFGLRVGVFWFLLWLLVFRISHNEEIVGGYSMFCNLLAVVATYALALWAKAENRWKGFWVSSWLMGLACIGLFIQINYFTLFIYAVLSSVGNSWFNVVSGGVAFKILERAKEAKTRKLEYLAVRELPLAAGRISSLLVFWFSFDKFGEWGLHGALLVFGFVHMINYFVLPKD